MTNQTDAKPTPLPGLAGAAAGAPPDVATVRAWADALALAHFGLRFPGTVRWAPRLRYRAGDYTPATRVIRVSLPYYLRYGYEETMRILLHELCHWWLFRQGVHHREDSPVFQRLLTAHGAPAHGLPLQRSGGRRLRLYVCPCCGMRYHYRRRVNYACGRCCRRWSGGRFDPRFRLVPVPGP